MYSQNVHHGSVGTASVQMPPPKTPNDIYGFAQKAILHSIFDKQLTNGQALAGQSSHGGHGNLGTQNGYIKTRHTTPFISNLG